MLRIIGDIHGDMDLYRKCVGDSFDSIQLGDFSIDTQDFVLHGADDRPCGDHRILLGNHDNHNYQGSNKTKSNHFAGKLCPRDMLDRFGVVKGTPVGDVFYVSGAESPDKHLRTEGVDWWRQEELTFRQARQCLDQWDNLNEDYSINIVVSHDCPSRVADMMYTNSKHPTFTQQLLNEILLMHQPRLWVFGHHHRNETIHLGPTTFRCLDEGETIDIYS